MVTSIERYRKLLKEAKLALDTLIYAIESTKDKSPLPPGHPGHEAYLNIVAIPRAKDTLTKIKEQL
jgi:hypothetical protein